MSPRILCPAWFAIVQGTSFEIDRKKSKPKDGFLILSSVTHNIKIEVKKIENGDWQIICQKNQKLIHQIELSELELAAAFAWTSNYLKCSEEFKEKFTPDAAVENKFIRDRQFLNFPLPGKEKFSLYLTSRIRNTIKIMLDLK